MSKKSKELKKQLKEERKKTFKVLRIWEITTGVSFVLSFLTFSSFSLEASLLEQILFVVSLSGFVMGCTFIDIYREELGLSEDGTTHIKYKSSSTKLLKPMEHSRVGFRTSTKPFPGAMATSPFKMRGTAMNPTPNGSGIGIGSYGLNLGRHNPSIISKRP